MKHKNISYRRKSRKKAITRKMFIGLHCMYWTSLETDVRRQGQLSKGKVHCSCPICSCKSTKYMNKTTNSLSGYSVSDRRKFDALNASYEEYKSIA